MVATPSVVRYQRTEKTVKEIAYELDAQYLLMGSIRRSAQVNKVNIQLVEGPKDRILWSATFERTTDDMIGLQSVLSAQVIKVIQIDPGYRRAYLGLATALSTLGSWEKSEQICRAAIASH